MKKVSTEHRDLSYDFLVVATGADMRPEEVPGLEEHAQTIWTPREMLELRLALYDLLEEAREGRNRRVLFLVAPNNKCAGPSTSSSSCSIPGSGARRSVPTWT